MEPPKIRRNASNTGNMGKGRPKGALNKTTVIAKDMIANVADRLGGADRMLAWAQSDLDNEKIFWASIYPRLLPLQVTGEGGGPLQITIAPNDAAL